MINPVNLYGVVFSSLVASGFWTHFQCFNENVDCRISFYVKSILEFLSALRGGLRYQSSSLYVAQIRGLVLSQLLQLNVSSAWGTPCDHVLGLLARIRMISRCLSFWFHVLKSSKTTFLHPNSLEMPTSQSSKATPQQLIFGVLSLAGGWHFVTSFWPYETGQLCISTLVKCKERAACRCKACDQIKRNWSNLNHHMDVLFDVFGRFATSRICKYIMMFSCYFHMFLTVLGSHA